MTDDYDQPHSDPDPSAWDDLDHAPEPADFTQDFQIHVSVTPRTGHTPRRPRATEPLPGLEPARAALPAPATPFPDIIPQVMPHGSITTLSGASGVGKTAWLASFIRALQLEAPVNGHPTTRPSDLGFIAVDRPYRDHAVWFSRAQCAPFKYYSLRDDDAVVWEHFRDYRRVPSLFQAALDRLDLLPGGLVIVDPLALFIPGKLIDYKDAAIGLATLDRIIRARRLTLLGVFHVGKEKGNKNDRYLRPQDRILGSGGQVGYSETAMYLMSPAETGKEYYEVGWVPHQIREESFRLRRNELGLFVPCEDLDSAIAQDNQEAQALACFADDTIHFAAWLVDRIMTTCNVKDRRAKELIADLLRQGLIEKVARGNYRRTRPAQVGTGTI